MEIDRIREELEESKVRLQKQLSTISDEISSLQSFQAECERLWVRGDCERLFQALEGRGFQIIRQIQTRLKELEETAKNTGEMLDATNSKIAEGVVCPTCNGVGKLSRIERLPDPPFTPVLRSQVCSLCGGSGRLKFQS